MSATSCHLLYQPAQRSIPLPDTTTNHNLVIGRKLRYRSMRRRRLNHNQRPERPDLQHDELAQQQDGSTHCLYEQDIGQHDDRDDAGSGHLFHCPAFQIGYGGFRCSQTAMVRTTAQNITRPPTTAATRIARVRTCAATGPPVVILAASKTKSNRRLRRFAVVIVFPFESLGNGIIELFKEGEPPQ